MKKSTQKNRIESRASHTALMAAIYRFLATKEAEEDFRGPDHLAKLFLPSKAKFFLSFAGLRKVFKRKLEERGPGSYPYVTARTRYFDELFIEALRTKIPQIVFLGAGYDTRTLRYQELLGSTRIFELDVPTTQQEKKRIIEKNRLQLSGNLSLVPIDFNRDQLREVLVNADYDPALKTLFLWEGVTMYITEDAVKSTLDFVKNNSGAGSSIAFDYIYESVITDECDYYGAKELAKIVQNTGESFTFGIPEGSINDFLEKQGFSSMEHFSPEEFENKYLNKNTGAFFGHMYGFACHVHAEKVTE